MKKIAFVLLIICSLSIASSYTALDHGFEKHYKVGERVVIPISLDLFPEGESSFECLAPNDEKLHNIHETDFIPNVLYAPGSNQIDFAVSQCQKVGKKDGNGNYVYKADVTIVTDTETMKKRIIARNRNNIITIDNEYIPIENIKDIYVK